MDIIDGVIKNDKTVVKELLEQGADPNFTDDGDNITPLHFAVAYNSKDVIHLLITAGADLNARNRDGLTPFGCAVNPKKEGMVKVLLKYQKPANLQTR